MRPILYFREGERPVLLGPAVRELPCGPERREFWALLQKIQAPRRSEDTDG